METSTSIQNWAVGNDPEVLQRIDQSEVNIAIFNRDVSAMDAALESLRQHDFEFRANGDVETVLHAITHATALKDYVLIQQDIKYLFTLFSEAAGAGSYKLLLTTVSNNMCRKFHTDINDLRMLCTYVGPGTLWLTEDNANRAALKHFADNDSIVLDNSKIKQAQTGAAVILKGAVYPKEGTKAILHRSPTIEGSGQNRVLLRIDTDAFANF